MKLLLKQYLSSLKERDELDVVLPDILSGNGFTVFSRPKRGTRQYGVDVAAIGEHPTTKTKTLFLLSIKSGDLTRDEWDTGKQALRPSLSEIIDVYIPKHVPARYKSLPIVVALCFGGDIQEDVRLAVDSFMDKHTVAGLVDFEEWNGDYIANQIANGLLRENIFPKAMQASFRKAVAFVDEPSICEAHFLELLRQLTAVKPSKPIKRLQIARQIYLATWTVFVWCRDVENLESAYRISTYAALYMWDLCHSHFGSSKNAKATGEVMDKALALHKIIALDFNDRHVAPYCAVKDGLAISVPSIASVDINLKLFEVLGRVALIGLWLIHLRERLQGNSITQFDTELDVQLQKLLVQICDMINNNPALYTPLRDDHAIEITLTSLFLMHCGANEFLGNWIEQITLSSIFSYKINGQYPCVFREYSDLAMHPKTGESYKKEATIGSILYPTLGVWLAILQDAEHFQILADFHSQDMSHSTWQLWIPNADSEENFYINSEIHGSCITHVNTKLDQAQFLELVRKEIIANTEFHNLSAMSFGQWPIILMACQIYRLPIPPQFWTMQIFSDGRGSIT
jgi:hypothetical protein